MLEFDFMIVQIQKRVKHILVHVVTQEG